MKASIKGIREINQTIMVGKRKAILVTMRRGNSPITVTGREVSFKRNTDRIDLFKISGDVDHQFKVCYYKDSPSTIRMFKGRDRIDMPEEFFALMLNNRTLRKEMKDRGLM
jgi:hypothetical protein